MPPAPQDKSSRRDQCPARPRPSKGTELWRRIKMRGEELLITEQTEPNPPPAPAGLRCCSPARRGLVGRGGEECGASAAGDSTAPGQSGTSPPCTWGGGRGEPQRLSVFARGNKSPFLSLADKNSHPHVWLSPIPAATKAAAALNRPLVPAGSLPALLPRPSRHQGWTGPSLPLRPPASPGLAVLGPTRSGPAAPHAGAPGSWAYTAGGVWLE